MRFAPDMIAVDRLALNLVNARFRGAGLDLDEPRMDAVADLTIDTKALTATFDKFTVNPVPLSVANGRLVIQIPDKGEAVVEGSGPAVVGLGRLGKTLKLYINPRGPESMHGQGTGHVQFRYSGGVTSFGGALDIVTFSVGLPTARIGRNRLFDQTEALYRIDRRWLPRRIVARTCTRARLRWGSWERPRN